MIICMYYMWQNQCTCTCVCSVYIALCNGIKPIRVIIPLLGSYMNLYTSIMFLYESFYLYQVPSSYIDLQKLVEIEAKRCHEVEKPPVLSQKEFATLAGDTGDITDPEELSLGIQLAHEYMYMY